MGDLYHGGFFSVDASPPSGVTAVQDGPTSIIVSWTPSSGATGYRISYSGGGSSDSVTVGNTNTHTLMGLTNGESYTISIAGISSSSGAMLRAPLLVGDVALGKSKNHPMQCAWNQSPHATMCLCVCGSRFVMIVCPCKPSARMRSEGYMCVCCLSVCVCICLLPL